MRLVEYADDRVWAITVAEILAGQLASELDQNDRCRLVLAGGTTPAPVYRQLGRLDIDWSRVSVMPSDERCVSQESPRSNYRMIAECLAGTPASRAVLVPLFLPGRQGAAPGRIGDAIPATVCVLGLGEDMHTASLFPLSPQIEQAMAGEAPPVMAMTAPDGEERMTLTCQELARSTFIHFLITGPGKRRALERAIGEPDRLRAPAGALLDSAMVHHA